MSEMYTKEESKQLGEILELAKEMLRLYCTDDGVLKNPIPMIGMVEGIEIGMAIGIAMHFQMAYITEKRKQSLTQSESFELNDD